MRKISLVLIIFILLFSVENNILAHQPRIVYDEKLIKVENPEVSQAFYGELKGESVYYQIEERDNFNFYIGLLSPQIEGADKDFSVEVSMGEEIIFVLDGTSQEWELFYEEFGGDYYYEGPENKISAGPGVYTLKVFSPDNRGKYVLVVGEKEEFPLKEIFNTIKTLPKLKGDFFEKSPLTAFFNIIGLFTFGPIIFILVIIFSILLYRKRKKVENK
ncbi:MAG: hypothetical protein ABIB55_00240 [Candidatus Nealsonbacteria bacterium]